MAKFPLQYTEKTIPAVGTSVRADLDMRTGGQELAEAFGGLGETITDLGLKFKRAEEKIALQRQKDLDTRSAIQGESLLEAAKQNHLLFREQNADTSLWEANLKEENRKVLEQIANLDMSDVARELFLVKANSNIFISEKKVLIDISKQEREDTFEAVTKNLIEAIGLGDVNKVAEAKAKFQETFRGRVDKDEAEDRFQAAVKVGRENRQKRVLNEWQRRIAEKPNETAAVLNTELEARGRDEGVIPEGVLPSETIQSLLNTTTNRRTQLIAQSNEAFENRKGDETERLSKLLVDGELIEQEIDEIDLRAFGDQKEDEFKWKQNWKKILHNTIKLTEPLVSDESTYDALVVGSEAVERGAKSPAEWEQEFAEAWADGELEKNDRRDLRSKDIVATKTMQNRAFSEATTNARPRLVELRDDELAGLVAARDNALRIKDLKTVNILNFSIKKAQIQKWNFGRYRTELRSQLSQNPDWSQKQIFVAEDILADQFDRDIAQLMLEFEADNPDQSILKTPPADELKDVWSDLSQEDKATIWELRMRGAPISEIMGELPK